LVEIANNLWNYHQALLVPFYCAVRASGRKLAGRNQAHWESKHQELHARFEAGDTDVEPDKELTSTISFFFPSVSKQLDAALQHRSSDRHG